MDVLLPSRTFHHNRRGLTRPDLMFALDHSRRCYLVRPSIPAEYEGGRMLTIIRLRDGKHLVLSRTCTGCTEPWANTDAYAERRWQLCNAFRRKLGYPEF